MIKTRLCMAASPQVMVMASSEEMPGHGTEDGEPNSEDERNCVDNHIHMASLFSHKYSAFQCQ